MQNPAKAKVLHDIADAMSAGQEGAQAQVRGFSFGTKAAVHIMSESLHYTEEQVSRLADVLQNAETVSIDPQNGKVSFAATVRDAYLILYKGEGWKSDK